MGLTRRFVSEGVLRMLRMLRMLRVLRELRGLRMLRGCSANGSVRAARLRCASLYDENQARQQLEPRANDWQPSGGDWMPEGWDAREQESDAAVPPAAPSPPPPASPSAMPLQPSSRSPPPADYDSDAYELDQERMLEEQGRASSIHARPWHEVPNGATEPIHWLDYIKRLLEWLGLSLAQGQQAQRPLSPAPERSQFQTEDAFQQEQARWFREHSNGAELLGTRHEQNTLFSRLKDKLVGLRRTRANPSAIRHTARIARLNIQYIMYAKLKP